MTISVLDKDGNPQTLDPPTQTTLAAILAKLSSDPATQTTLAAILAKLIAAPATEAKQDAIVTALGALATAANQSTANTTLATLLTAGTPITGQSLESGGAGALGWLASIRKKIAAFGTAGAPSADVVTVQGVSEGTALPVDTELPTAALLADATALPTTPLLGAAAMLSNGATLDFQRGNVDGTALASGTRTVATSSADIINYNARGVLLFVNVTAVSGTGGITPALQAKDPITGNYGTLISMSSAITSTGLRVYMIYPGASTTGALAQAVQQVLPRTWRVFISVVDASSYTYSVGYSLIV